MASLAEKTGLAEDTDSGANGAKPPISTHPAFPAIVALWFAALLGMGSLVVPVALIEQLVVTTGISSLVSATAPPLGVTARGLIALSFAVAGALCGLLIARQVAKAHAPAPALRFEPVAGGFGSRKPINAHDELGDEGFDGRGTRRRSLAIEVDHGPSEFLEFAPLPGQIVDNGYGPTPDILVEPEFETEFETAAEEPELAEPEMPEPEMPKPEIQLEEDITTDRTTDRQEFISSIEPAMAAEPQDFQPEQDNTMDSAWFEPDDMLPEAEMPDYGTPEGLSEDLSESVQETTPRQDYQVAPLEDLGLVQLAQRLGSSLERKREWRSARAKLAASAAKPSRAIPTGIDMAEPDEANEAMVAWFGGSRPAPAAMPEAATPGLEDCFELGSFIEDENSEPESMDEADLGEADLGEAAGDMPLARIQPEEKQVFQMPERQPVIEPRKEAPQTLAETLAEFAHHDTEIIDEEDAGMEDLAASFTLPINRVFVAAPAPSVPETAHVDNSPFETPPSEIAAEDAAAELDDPAEFGSLLRMRNPFRERPEEFVRIEDEPEDEEGIVEPAVVFPNDQQVEQPVAVQPMKAALQLAQPPRPFDPPASEAERERPATAARFNPEENERALREALLNLQRMSGTA